VIPPAAHRAEQLAVSVVLAAVGVVLGTIEAFLVPLRLFGHIEGLSVVLAFAGNAGVGSLAGVGTRAVRVAVVPVGAWFITVGALTVYAPGGDVVLPGQLPSDPGVVWVTMLFLAGGLLGGGLAVVVTMVANARAAKVSGLATPGG
jgi:hypothetical protein